MGFDSSWVDLKKLTSLLVASFAAIDKRGIALLKLEHRPICVEQVLVQSTFFRLHRFRDVFLTDQDISDALLELANITWPGVISRYFIF